MISDLVYSDDEDDDSMSLPPLSSTPTLSVSHRVTPPLPDTPLPRETNNNSPEKKTDLLTQIKTEETEEEECSESIDFKAEQDIRYTILLK